MIDRFVDVPNGYLYTRTHGEGPDVVLLNAGYADLRMWDTTIAWLAGIARVTTFDHRDTGLSSRAIAPYSELDDLAAVLDAGGVETALVVGVSDGARRGLAFTHRYPDRVERVVAIGPALGGFPDPSPEETEARQPMLELFAPRADPGGGRRVRRGGGGPGHLGAGAGHVPPAEDARAGVRERVLHPARGLLGAELDPPVKTRLGELTRPITVLAGGRDFRTSELWGRRIVREAPDATLTVIPEADHYPMLSTPKEFERILRDLLA
ncbi:alpha/beta fold hydrolase [Tenggerimyces flavus]|uniref:Alpha/beta fold hydrolase n=1 Tax=Tenggerimyces flavus TaxID=1708749 RepID=A0ABV7Y4D9_9ACTN|nr:alpha/beta hydrolase [Tenggerimyces flavus]MBM7790482.1 pimeloyl-ACP methyl ester carboxylesterase [Tenggerimyces flavus]